MAERHNHSSGLLVRSDQPLIGVIFQENGQELVRYVAGDTDDTAPSSEVTEAALRVIGAWSDLDWEETEQALDRIRHESVPTPPLDL